MRRLLRPLTLLALVAVMALGGAAPALAQGEIIPRHPPIPPEPWPSAPVIKSQRIDVEIDGQAAVTRVEQVFYNPQSFPIEGTYIFPLPEASAISQFVMYVDGERLDGKLLDKDEARRIYEEVVRSRRDPALLEYIGRDAFQASVFPIPPRGERKIVLEYTQVLKTERGLVHYQYPLRSAQQKTIGEVVFTARIKSPEPIKSVYSPSYQMAASRPDERSAVLGFEAKDLTPSRDVEVFYTVSTDTLGLSLLPFRESGEDGFFLLLLSPGIEVAKDQIQAKDVILVLDTSGSMDGEKIRQAKEALRFVLTNLGERDRFNVVTFSSGVEKFAPGLRPVSEREKALDFVGRIEAVGSTNIDGALQEALRLADPERPAIVIFLTDGLPTVGATEPSQIIANVKGAAPKSVRLFAFGVGYDVNTILLDALATNHRGVSEYVKPGESLEERLSGFYQKVGAPVLTDVTLDFGDVEVFDLYPRPLPDIFQGGQLVLVGRYKGSAKTVTVKVTGTVEGGVQSFEYSGISFPAESSTRSFIPRLWATRKIGFLINEVRIKGANDEVVSEIVSLSKRYGVITPYTSFLVEEPSVRPPRGGTPVPLMPMYDVGREAVQQSQAASTMKAADQAAPIPATTWSIGDPLMREASDKVFYRRDDGVWVDSAYQAGGATRKVPFGSDDYFRLASQRPETGRYLSVGDRVILMADGTAYEVTAPGQSVTTPDPTPDTGNGTVTVPPKSDDTVTVPSERPRGLWGRIRSGVGRMWDRLTGLFRR